MGNNNNVTEAQNDNSQKEGKPNIRQSSISAYETPQNDKDRYLIDKLKEATRTGNWKPFKKLLKDTKKIADNNININSINTMGDNVFLLICKIDNIKPKERFNILKTLIKLNADLTHCGEDKQNCLHIAASQQEPGLLKFLLKYILKYNPDNGFELIKQLIEKQDSLGNLPLHYAAQRGHQGYVGALSNFGYLNLKKNNQDQTAFEITNSHDFKIALVFQNASITAYNQNKLPVNETMFIREQYEYTSEKSFKPRYGREKSRSFNVKNDNQRGLRKSQSVLVQTTSISEDSLHAERASYSKPFTTIPLSTTPPSLSSIRPESQESPQTNLPLSQNLKH